MQKEVQHQGRVWKSEVYSAEKPKLPLWRQEKNHKTMHLLSLLIPL